MATTKNENKQNVNENVKANNVSDNNATDESSNESNESATAKVDNVENVENNATDESKAKATTAPTSEQIAAARVEQKHQTEITNRYKLDAPTEVEKSKFAGAYVMGVWRAPKDVKKNGDKTFFKIYFNGTIYDGYTSTEFCDAVGIERKHRNGNTPKVVTMLDKLQALKTAIEAIGSEETDFVNFAKIVASKIESEKLESDRTAFVAKYETLISALPYLTTAVATTLHGDDFVKMALKLGYKFADTPTKATDTKATDTPTESESKSK